MSKKVLLVGNGGRENALAEALARSPQKPKIFVFMNAKNPAIEKMATEVFVAKSLMDFDELKKFAKKIQPDFAIVGPDDPIGGGAVDELAKVGVPSMAPTAKLARLESSKSFTRDLLKKYSIPGNPDFRIFCSMDNMRDYSENVGEIVVKYDGLAGGKGVKVQGDHFDSIEEGLVFAKECIQKSSCVIVEEKLVGEEFSAMFFADGKTIKSMPISQDHKRAYDDDMGPNTGGMGVISDSNHSLPFLTNKDVEEAENITRQVMFALEKECGEKYHGIMYGGFIVTKGGVRLIEYNARFGDPEAMNVLPLLETDFVEVCEAVINEGLADIDIKFAKKATVCKYVVPKGYPDDPQKDVEIKINKSIIPENVKTFYASVYEKDEKLYLKGSRAIAFVGIGDSIIEAGKLTEKACESIEGPVFHRKDIGTAALIKKRVDHMKHIRK